MTTIHINPIHTTHKQITHIHTKYKFLTCTSLTYKSVTHKLHLSISYTQVTHIPITHTQIIHTQKKSHTNHPHTNHPRTNHSQKWVRHKSFTQKLHTLITYIFGFIFRGRRGTYGPGDAPGGNPPGDADDASSLPMASLALGDMNCNLALQAYILAKCTFTFFWQAWDLQHWWTRFVGFDAGDAAGPSIILFGKPSAWWHELSITLAGVALAWAGRGLC